MAMSLEGFAEAMVGLVGHMPMAEHAALEESCQVVEKAAKAAIGTYTFGWPALQPETIARKANGDTPLLETGELRDSYQHTVQAHAGYIGSNNPKATWHELGTSRIPPRPVLQAACIAKETEVHEITGRHLISALSR